MTEWSRCSDKLPPYDHDVLVYCVDRFEVSCIYNSGTKKKPVASWSCDYCAFPVYWAELPEPPEDK